MSKGITKEIIIREAEKLIEEQGITQFSLHELAERLHIRTASLYTHVSGLDEILEEASMDILHQYHDHLMQAIQGKNRTEAVLSLAEAERKYAEKHSSFYDLIMNLQLSDNERLKKEASCIIEPVMTILDQYHLSSRQKVNLERLYRATVFGFISQEKHLYFSHLSKDTDESFLFCIHTVIHEIEAMEHAE